MSKVPFDITFHPSWYHKNAGTIFGSRFFEDAAYRVQADRDMRRALYDHFGDYGIGEKDPAARPVLGSDLLACGYLHSAILGCDIRYNDGSSPEVLCKQIDDDEAMNLVKPDLESSPLWRNQEEQIAYLMNEYGYVLPNTNLMGIQNIAIDLRGTDIFFDYLEEPEIAHHILSVCTDLSIEIGRRYRELSPNVSAGVTSIVKKTVPDVYLTSNCTVDLVSNETYEEYLLKYDNILAKEFPVFGIHHCGSSMEHVVDGYTKVNNLRFAEVGAGSDLAAVRKKLPNVYLNARYSPVHLKETDRAGIQKDYDKFLADNGSEDLLSVSCVGIDAQTTDDQVRAFLDVVTK